MRFLRTSDYYRRIQPDELDTLLKPSKDKGYDSTQMLIDLENSAIEEIKSYLSARYDLTRVFSDTPIYDSSTAYYGQSRVQYHESLYDATITYAVNDRRSYNGAIYKCSTTIGTPEAFNLAHWTFLCLDYAIFYITLPYPEFQEFTNYSAGNQVWFSDNYTYTAIKDTKGQLPNSSVYSEYGADKDFPIVDNGGTRFLEDTTNSSYWSRSASKYSVTGTLPTDGTKWTAADNRNQLLIQMLLDIVMYNAWMNVAPRNIPELRIINYKGESTHDDKCVLGWLRKVANGEISANLAQKYPQQGLSVIFNSGAPKSQNTY
ncbi:hypothetical protein UFOVP87_16 [uncultured Caudovirales phage]|uniref:Uncharacterized protein n=1 Tax=uncultured Caudovirales phage TaxID=2100421 RepID=A0A6J5KXN7_9CAUD|nr:hypothetical protein UFOVP87_16 [uncultured Caudovirales phage]